jgi:nitrite reductase/ring-hydroxylating ferredoxin subunit
MSPRPAAPVQPLALLRWSALSDRQPAHAAVDGVDLVVIRVGDGASVLYGRCTHRNALLSEGFVTEERLVCRYHGWDYHLHSGCGGVDDGEALKPFAAWVEDDQVWVDADEVRRWRARTPVDFLDDELDP